MKTPLLGAILLIAATRPLPGADIEISTTAAPPLWALLERELLRQSSAACDRFAAKVLDARGYLLHTPRWGTLDGPDDAIETFHNWTLLYALGGSPSVLENFRRALEGHYRQYGELRTTRTKLAENGAYHNEFITQSDWFHTGEGMRGFMFLGLADPRDPVLRVRLRRFAGLYMNEDPSAANYDPVHKVIKSLWTGSKGPMLRKATTYDWVGDPVPGRFALLHGPHGRKQLVDMMTVYDKMLAHCDEYLDSVGDHPLNLASTGLALNAYMLTGETKYRDWILEYVGAWKQRTGANGGNIPTNVGLDGRVGGEHGGRWYKGTYGWNFTIFDGEIGETASRNTVTSGSWPGFGNAYLVSRGDRGFVDTLRRQIDNLHAQKKVVGGVPMIPHMFGDPRGYKHTGREEWYDWRPDLFEDRLTEIYLWSLDPGDRARIRSDPWLDFLEGKNPSYPESVLQAALARVRLKVQELDEDDSTPDTRLADYLMDFNPAETDALTRLTLGAFLNGRIWTLHARLRYFDPVKRRSGLPDDVAALVRKFDAGSVTVELVNVNQLEPRYLVLQAGAYGEHQFSKHGTSTLSVRLAPGAVGRLTLEIRRHANDPTLRQPW